MHITYHVWIAAIGGFLFILVGIARQMERSRLVKMNRKPESQWVWVSLLGLGVCLLIFAFGIMTYHPNQ
ncbi:MAG: hypothetical protein JSU01_12945 [Bacteroidetes bacterium]|nr:hypothetical protein [Bacteroidota bacterium]